MTKVSIIGAGNLGSKIAYTLAQREVADDVVLLDILKDMARGNAMDISQSIAYIGKTNVISGDYRAISGSDVVVITAGKPRSPETKDRLNLAGINAKIVHSVCEKIKMHAPGSIIITCTNPVDLMNHVSYRTLGFERNRVIGFGGRLDSARFRHIASMHLGVKMSDLSCDVIGEHGDSMVPLFSRLRLKGKRLNFSDYKKEKITSSLRSIALEIISLKGVTDFAPARCVADIVGAILDDSGLTVPCSMNLSGEYGFEGISIGVPVKLGKKGAEIINWKLSDHEKNMFQKSAQKLEKLVSELEY